MCPCKRHYDITKPCTCQCNHIEKASRLKKYVYKHAHECSQKNELFVYRPATIGSVMFPIIPVCIEAEVELMRVRIEDD
jgi:hypothetical protein